MNKAVDHPHDHWRWLNWSIVLVLAAAVVMIALISSGVFDPKPVGKSLGTTPLELVELKAESHHLEWLDIPAPSDSYSLRLTAALAGGDLDSAYGLALGGEGQYLVAAVSPTGYVSFWWQQGQQLEKIIPWRTWPHVRHGLEANEIWLDVVHGNLASIRTNGEILWQGEQPVAGQGIGLWTETFARPATFDFESLELFAELPSS